MNKRVIGAILLLIGLAVAGCTDRDRIPPGVLPRDKMQGLLWDMIQADQYASYLTKDSTKIDLKLERLRLYQQVFLLHGVSRDEFKKSYDFYMSHPDMAQTLFDSLLSKGNRLRAEAYSRPATPGPTVTTPVPDTAHKAPAQHSFLPLFKHPLPDTHRAQSMPAHQHGIRPRPDTVRRFPDRSPSSHPVAKPLVP